MRTCEYDSHLKLVELADLSLASPSPFVCEYRTEFMKIAEWARTFLCCSHEELGRNGPVCPFVEMSMDRGLFWQTAFGGQPSLDDVRDLVIAYRDWFLALEPTNGRESRLKAILVLFPGVSEGRAPEVIDAIQAELKPEFVEKGLMIGQFHARSEEPGLWNARFRPLRTPIPLLAIRHMVPGDIAFLAHDERLLAAYDRIFGEEASDGFSEGAYQTSRG